MSEGFSQYRGRNRIAGREKAVVHPAALAPRRDDTCPAQVGQVARDFWLAYSQNFYEVANANFLVGNEIEQAQARAVGQGAEEKLDRK